jgi:hypothetical protein
LTGYRVGSLVATRGPMMVGPAINMKMRFLSPKPTTVIVQLKVITGKKNISVVFFTFFHPQVIVIP